MKHKKKAQDQKESLNVKFEIKQIHEDEDDEFFRFEGLASTFGNIDLVDDIMEPGSFKESLVNTLPIILWQHRSSEPIGMPEEIRETPEGLFVKVRLPKEDSLVRERVIPQIKIGSIRTMSIGFRVRESSFDEVTDIRRIQKVDLLEISLVTFPANPQARVTGFKSVAPFLQELSLTDDQSEKILEYFNSKQISVDDLKFLDREKIQERRDFESNLRESGLFSKQAAIKLASYFNWSESRSEEEESNAVIKELQSLSKKFSDQEVQSHFQLMSNKFGE